MKAAQENMRQVARAWYILPNTFTLASLFAGFYAIVLLSSDGMDGTFFYASVALLIATVLDGLDGRVARLTGTQSEFGMQMDSLVDLVSFGVAPALLVYKWGLVQFGIWGVLASFAFAACGACRLARFNVLESQPKQHKGPSRYFVGLPIPLSAGTLVSTIMFHEAFFAQSYSDQAQVGVLCLTMILSFLMVSNVRFRTFKDLRLNPLTIFVLMACLGFLMLSSYSIHPCFSLLLVFFSYVVGGLFGEIFGYCYRAFKALRTSYR